MITVKGKTMTYAEVASRLKWLTEQLEDVREDVSEAEERLCELENDEYLITDERDAILEQMHVTADINDLLPTEFFSRGYRLTEIVYTAREIEQADLFGELPKPHHILTVLENGSGEVIREWQQPPSLSDIFETLY